MTDFVAVFQQIGVVADRPSASGLPDNYAYFATDVDGGTPYVVLSGAWMQSAGSVSGGGGGGVSSFNSRTGAVIPTAGDYTASDVGALPSTETIDQIAAANATAADWSNNSHKITSLASGTNPGDAINKGQLDSAISGLDWKQACRLASASALPTNTYSNGSSGVGATLTGVGFGALTVDGVTVVLGDRVLVKNEATGANKGIYVVTTVGAIATLYVLTRATDYDTSAEIVAGTSTYITEGSTNADTAWVMTTTGTVTVGTTALVFAQFGGGGGGAVSSVFTRTGAVTAQSGDYTAAQVGALAATASAGGVLAGNYPNPTFASGMGSALIFSQTLGTPGTTLDTGANAIPSTYRVLEVWIVGGNSTSAGLAFNVNITFNGDTAAHYDSVAQWRQGSTNSGQSLVAQTSEFGLMHPNSGTTAYPGVTFLTIPAYAATTFNKVGTMHNGYPDATASVQWAMSQMWGWRSTAAINQITATAGNAGNWIAGSTMYVFGR